MNPLRFNGSLGPYLSGSAAVHAGLLAGVLMLGPGAPPPPKQVYRIDFVANTPGIINRSRGGAKPAAPKKAAAPARVAAKVSAQTDPDAFRLGPPSLRPLPKPSFLSPAKPEREPIAPKRVEPSLRPAASPTEEAPAAATQAQAATEAGSGAGEGEDAGPVVAADMPDFPYPWYLTDLRSKIWDRWLRHMPPESVEVGVVFSILRDGEMVDLRVEFTSGDKSYDYAALNAVRDSRPFPPLPGGYKDRFLKVHVEFRAR